MSNEEQLNELEKEVAKELGAAGEKVKVPPQVALGVTIAMLDDGSLDIQPFPADLSLEDAIALAERYLLRAKATFGAGITANAIRSIANVQQGQTTKSGLALPGKFGARRNQ